MTKKKKILVVVGSGASIEFGMPSVNDINKLFEQWSREEFSLASNENDNLYSYFLGEIERYKQNHLESYLRKLTNFEEVLYAMYLLPSFYVNGIFTSSIGAFLAIKRFPDIRRFGNHEMIGPHLMTSLASYLIESLIHEFRMRCLEVSTNYKDQLDEWNGFLAKLDEDFELAFISLNYDNLVIQALPTLNTGFDQGTGLFQSDKIYYRKNWRCLLHLHGSVHFDFWEDYRWIDDLANSYNPNSRVSRRGRSSRHTIEGSVLPNTEIVIGYGKLWQLMGQPFRTYHAELDRLVYECDGALFLGYGFSDEHLNLAFSGFRKKCKRPVMLIDFAGDADTMTIRSCYDVLPSIERAVRLFGNDPLLMEWGDNMCFPTLAKNLIQKNEFESSSELDKPLSIWYGGMQNACLHYEKITNFLNN